MGFKQQQSQEKPAAAPVSPRGWDINPHLQVWVLHPGANVPALLKAALGELQGGDRDARASNDSSFLFQLQDCDFSWHTVKFHVFFFNYCMICNGIALRETSLPVFLYPLSSLFARKTVGTIEEVECCPLSIVSGHAFYKCFTTCLPSWLWLISGFLKIWALSWEPLCISVICQLTRRTGSNWAGRKQQDE